MISQIKSIDGIELTTSQQKRLRGLISIIRQSNPSRPVDKTVAHATKSFLLTVKKVGGRYEDLRSFRIDGGKGPVVVPAYSSSLDR